MNPLFFGSSAEPLFGVYHPPKASQERASGVVLCYPAGQEYMRAHRAFRQLALLLSRAGFHVLRFDYYGTGDSAGDAEGATLERWVLDIQTAADELKDTASLDDVALVGLRMGGSLAAEAAMQRDDVSHLVLWDAIVSGKTHMADLIVQARPQVTAAAMAGAAPAAQVIDVLGFAITEKLRSEIESIDLLSVHPRSDLDTLIVISHERDDQVELARSYRQFAPGTTFTCIPSDGNWNEVDDFGSVLIPQAIIREIVSYLSERVPG